MPSAAGEGLAVEVLDHVEVREGLEHGHLHELTLARAWRVEERRRERAEGVESRGLVGDDRGRVLGGPVRSVGEIREAGGALDEVVEACRVA
jgi:hypothetical protein